MQIEIIKGLVIVILFILTLGLGILPVKLVVIAENRSANRTSRQARYKRVLSIFSCYAAGVFLATCLLDLFPDVREKLGDVLDNAQILSSFPLSEFVMVCGLFMILIVEQVVLSCKEGFSHSDYSQVRTVKTIDRQNESDERLTQSAEFSRRSLDLEAIRDRPRSATFSHSSHQVQLNEDRPLLRNAKRGDRHDHGCSFNDIDHPDHSKFRSLLLLLALSLHSVFEGLAVGLQETSVDVLSICAALALHKCLLSFSLGLSLVQSELSFWGVVRSLVLFSLSSPLGIGIGLGITDLSNSPASHLAEGILQGLACGTFLYVTFFEMLPHEFNSSDDRMLKVLFLILGFATVCLILFFHKGDIKPTCYTGPDSKPFNSSISVADLNAL